MPGRGFLRIPLLPWGFPFDVAWEVVAVDGPFKRDTVPLQLFPRWNIKDSSESESSDSGSSAERINME